MDKAVALQVEYSLGDCVQRMRVIHTYVYVYNTVLRGTRGGQQYANGLSVFVIEGLLPLPPLPLLKAVF